MNESPCFHRFNSKLVEKNDVQMNESPWLANFQENDVQMNESPWLANFQENDVQMNESPWLANFLLTKYHYFSELPGEV